MEKIYIIGSGGFAREVAWLIEEINDKGFKYKIEGFIDENIENIGKKLNGYKVLGNLEFLNEIEGIKNIVIAIGNGKARENIVNKLKKVKYPNIIHPEAKISRFVELGVGIIICAGNIITTNIKIKNHVIINLDCTIGHDSILENYTTILPGVHVSGNVIIDERTSIGTGSVIIQGLKIGKDTTIGAGGVVVKDIPELCIAVGSPAKPIKYLEKN